MRRANHGADDVPMWASSIILCLIIAPVIIGLVVAITVRWMPRPGDLIVF